MARCALPARCRERGTPIGRANISFVLTAFRFRRYDLQSADKDPAALAQVFKENVIDLCENASLPLSDEDKALLDEWLVGKRSPPASRVSPEVDHGRDASAS